MNRRGLYVEQTGRAMLLLSVLMLSGPALPAAGGSKPAGAGSLLPQIAGWQQTKAPGLYSPESIFEYIDGAADLYLSFGFQELAVGNYQNGKKTTVDVEIYRHKEALATFGIYSQEKSSRSRFLAVGAEGYTGGGTLNFYSGQYYVKLYVYDGGTAADTILETFARQIAGRIGGSPSLPAQLKLFPAPGRVARSERYVAENFMGHSFLKHGFTNEYEENGKKYTVFLIDGQTPATAAGMMKQWAAQAKLKTTPAEGPVSLQDPFNGIVELRWQGRYIWGVAGKWTGAPAVLESIGQNIARSKPAPR